MRSLFLVACLLTITGCVRVAPHVAVFERVNANDVQFRAVANTKIQSNQHLASAGFDSELLQRLQVDLERISDRSSKQIYYISEIRASVERTRSAPFVRALTFVLSAIPILGILPQAATYDYTADYVLADAEGNELWGSTVHAHNRNSSSGWAFLRPAFAHMADLAALRSGGQLVADAIARDVVEKHAKKGGGTAPGDR